MEQELQGARQLSTLKACPQLSSARALCLSVCTVAEGAKRTHVPDYSVKLVAVQSVMNLPKYVKSAGYILITAQGPMGS